MYWGDQLDIQMQNLLCIWTPTLLLCMQSLLWFLASVGSLYGLRCGHISLALLQLYKPYFGSIEVYPIDTQLSQVEQSCNSPTSTSWELGWWSKLCLHLCVTWWNEYHWCDRYSCDISLYIQILMYSMHFLRQLIQDSWVVWLMQLGLKGR